MKCFALAFVTTSLLMLSHASAQQICDAVRQIVQTADKNFMDLRGRQTPEDGIYEAAIALPGAECFVSSKPPVYKCRWRHFGRNWRSQAERFGTEVQQCFAHPPHRAHSRGKSSGGIRGDQYVGFRSKFKDGPEVEVVATESTVLKHHIVTTIDFVVTPNHWRHVLGERSGPKDTVTSNRLHRQHSPPPASCKAGSFRPTFRGSILDADPPAQGVKIARRITALPASSKWRTYSDSRN